MAIPPSLFLLFVLAAISAARASARELRPSDHGLEYQDEPSSPASNPKPPPGMLSFFGASTSPPSLENASGGFPEDAGTGDPSNETGERNRARDVLLVASLACGATGVALLMASGLLFMFKYRKDRIGSGGNGSAPAVMRPMQLPPQPQPQK